MPIQPDVPTDVRHLDLKMAGPSSPSAVKRKADELEEEVATVEHGEEEKHGSPETKRMAKRRKKNKKKKKKDNGSKGGNEHKDKEETSKDIATEVEEALGENTQAKGLEDEAVDSNKTGDSNTSAPGLKKGEEEKHKKKGNRDKKGRMRKQSDREMPVDKLNGKKCDATNSPDQEKSERDGKGKKKSTASPSSSPHPEKHHTTPLSSKTVTTPKSLLKKSNDKTPTPRTKTVTFADDAKSTDGDSIANTVRFPAGIGDRSNLPRLPGSPEPHPALLAQHSSPSSSSSSSTTTTQQGALSPSLNPAEDYHNQQQDTKPQIAYLLNYYQARASWKFSKTKQNWIIRNIWNLAEFGAEVLQSALWAYVNGLVAQGPKGRLLAEAKEVAKTRREELGAVDAEDDPKYRRAKLVLTALGDDDIPSEDERDDTDGMDVDNEEDAYAEGGE